MKEPSANKEIVYSDNGDGTVTDPVHNIMWVKEDTWIEKGKLMTWHECQEFVREKNAEKFAGYSNWRFPTATDARTLFDPEASNSDIEGCEIHLDPIFTSGCGFSTWTSETRGAKAAMSYDLRSDYEFWLAKENSGFPSAVRIVRNIVPEAEEGEEERFVNNGDGTVTDNELGIMWKADDSYIDLDKWVSWEEAKTWVEVQNNIRFASYQNWRMPTRKEVQSIYDPSSPITDKYGDVVFLMKAFPAGSAQTCWTKTKHRTDPTLAIRFQMYNGDYKWHKMGLRSHGVRAVRDLKK